MTHFVKNYIVLLAIMISNVTFAETINITNGEWQPYLSEYSYEYGLASHILKEAFAAEGIKIKWGFYTWKRSYQLAKEGVDWDATAVWIASKDAKENFHISVPIVESAYVFFHHKDKDFKWDKMSDIIGNKIGITDGYNYGEDFTDLLAKKKITAQKVKSDEANFKKILSKRIDIFPSNPIVGYAQIRDIFKPEQVKKITHHPKQFKKTHLHLLISKNSSKGPYFAEKLSQGIQKIIAKGKLKKMYNDLNNGLYDKKKTKFYRKK